MILYPPVLALLLGSSLISLMLLYSAYYAINIIRNWDVKSGSELQLALERKTYLISTIVAYAFGFQLLSFFLFIYTANDLCVFFVGAMCAVGTLNVNPYGYPTLILKVVNFLLAGNWLILNHTDNKAYDYPLIKTKYSLLLLINPFIVAETVLQLLYFQGLHPNVITSCCGSLFSTESPGMASSLAAVPSIPMKIVFYSAMALVLMSGIYFYKTLKGGYLFSLLSTLFFFIALEALISFISLYFYELPTHHCPFCILQKDYGYIGYLLYTLLLSGSLSGLGVGTLLPFRNKISLTIIIPSIVRRLALVSLISYSVFAGISTYQIIFSHFKLEGY
ncbi:MAG: hypothetical protein ACLPN1_03215 [Dissulfurispiraceae bacterium]